MPIILWSSTPSGANNTDLQEIQFRVNAQDGFTNIDNVSGANAVYDAQIPMGSIIPELKVTPAEPKSEVRITYPPTVPGTATIKVVSLAGAIKEYYVNFLIDNGL